VSARTVLVALRGTERVLGPHHRGHHHQQSQDQECATGHADRHQDRDGGVPHEPGCDTDDNRQGEDAVQRQGRDLPRLLWRRLLAHAHSSLVAKPSEESVP